MNDTIFIAGEEKSYEYIYEYLHKYNGTVIINDYNINRIDIFLESKNLIHSCGNTI